MTVIELQLIEWMERLPPARVAKRLDALEHKTDALSMSHDTFSRDARYYKISALRFPARPARGV